MAAETSRSGGVDSYIGSLISLTSKSEIRYEGVLFTINTEEASIGLRNVRSFGTEGRRKDGPQIPPIDKVYEYIVFRGSDIKDLQVKSTPPVQQTASIHNDPAIIQSHYSQSATGASLTPVNSTARSDLGNQIPQGGLPRSPFQSNLPLYQPGGSLLSWGSSAPTTNGSGPTPPMYWQGYYGASSSLQNQTPLLQPPQGLPMPTPGQQSVENPVLNTSVPTGMSVSRPSDFQPMLSHPLGSGGFNTQTTMVPGQSSTLVSDPSLNLLPGQSSIVASDASTNLLPVAQSISRPLLSPLSNELEKDSINPMPNQAKLDSSLMTSFNGMPESLSAHSADIGTSSTPLLVTPEQLLQSGSVPVSASQPLQTVHKDVEEVRLSSSVPMLSTVVSASASAPISTESEAPLLPLPSPSNPKFNGEPLHSGYIHRGGHGRGRRSELSNSATSYTEDFDFEAMNEKFNKDEVWGHLGKSKTKADQNEDSLYDDDNDVEYPQVDIKPVYNKDDFFDTLSSNSSDNRSRVERPRFAEQMRLDTETFGYFSRHRGGRGGRPGRGWYQRGGYFGRGYGYAGRSRGYHNVYRPI